MRITDMITQDEFAGYFINFSPLEGATNGNFDLRVKGLMAESGSGQVNEANLAF